jgi:signal transduction histidine kinase
MRILNSIVKFFDGRVKKFGAPYFTFAIFGIINYPLAYFIRVYIQNVPERESLFMRSLATFLCLGLLVKDYWPQKAKKFLSLYWFCTVTMSLTVLVAYLLLKNNFSLEWLVNASVGLLIAMLVLDWAMFILSLFLGAIIGYVAFTLQYGHIESYANSENVYLAIYLYSMIVLFCAVFARSREAFNVANAEILKQEVTKISNELNRSLLAKESFLNNVTHEVRGPTQIISALAEDMLDNWKEYSEERKREFIAQISDNGGRLFDLVNNWMDMTSLDTSKSFMFELSKNNILDAINSGVRDGNVIGRKKNIKIVNKKQDVENKEEYVAMFHKYRLAQVVTNVCANAIKFSPENSQITVDIEKCVYLEQDGKSFSAFYVSISDEGPGIPEKDMEKMFDSFVQGDDAKNKVAVTGVGLGLSISKKIIHAHGGKIWAENNVNVPGCTFRFFIPIEKTVTKDGNIVTPENSQESLKSTTDKKKEGLNIVFLDDEDMGCMSGKLILSKLGHKVTTFTEASDFFEHLKAHTSEIDLVFVDMIMPVMGVDIIKEMKAIDEYKNIPIIVQSGLVSDTELNSLLTLGTVGYVLKPYDAAKVAKEIEKMQAKLVTLAA